MSKRIPISQSMRWSIFARDAFCCRYCGRQAGQDGVVLVVDHIVSVADGGDNRVDNLATACQICNGGKSARSLIAAPTHDDVIARQTKLARESAEKTERISESIRLAAAATKDREQVIVDLKCAAYGAQSTRFNGNEANTAHNLIEEFGADKVFEWYESAATKGISPWKAILYVCGCARRTRERAAK